MAFVRFLGTGSSAFSLSSLDMSSLTRFLVRVVACLGAALVGAALDAAGLVVGVVRVLRVTGAGAGAFFVVVGLVGAAFTGAGLGARVAGADMAGAGMAGSGMVRAGMAGASTSTNDIWRWVAGTRLTRRSRRARRLAHWASHIARNFSLRALTGGC